MNPIVAKIGAVLASGVMAITGTVPAFAAEAVNMRTSASVHAAMSADTPSATDLTIIEGQEDADQAQVSALTKAEPTNFCGWDCIDKKLKELADRMISNRIAALHEVKTRVENKQNLTDADRASLTSEVNTNIDKMTDLKAKIDADTEHGALIQDVASITVDYREYALIIPQVSLLMSGYHKEWVYTNLSAVAADLQTKINAMSDGERKEQAQTKLDDMKAKIADAKVNADAAIAGIINLAPDHGDATVHAANKAALAAADSKLAAAHQDYVTARADVVAINALLNGSGTTGGAKPATGSVSGNVIMKANPMPAPAAYIHASGNAKFNR